MTEYESTVALITLNREYMSHPPKERVKLYDEYIRKRGEIKEQLKTYIMETKKVKS